MSDEPKSPCPTAQAIQMDRINLSGPIQRGDHNESPRAYVSTGGFAVPAASPIQQAQWISQRRS